MRQPPHPSMDLRLRQPLPRVVQGTPTFQLRPTKIDDTYRSGYALSIVRSNIGETFWGDSVSCTSVGSSVVTSEATSTFPPDILTLYAPTAVVARQSSDLARWKTALPTSTSTGLLGSSVSSQTGLSTGAKADIGVGCAAAVVAAAVTIWLLFRSRSRKRKLLGNELPTAQMDEPLKDKDQHAELADEAALQEMTGHERQMQPVTKDLLTLDAYLPKDVLIEYSRL
ncbi:hypothetical protein E8E11_009075 [Didymella keratinophila]|nr:hypothetical protein E8E11_009075 [Didymella keratinophila]